MGVRLTSGRRIRRQVLRFLSSLAVVFPVLAMVVGASASEESSADPAPPAHSRLEMNLSKNANNGTGTSTMGEPEIAQNPLHPSNLYVDWTTFSYPPGGRTSDQFPCGGVASTDGGLSWQPAPLPLTNCADAVAAYGPDGSLYAGGIVTTFTAFVPPPCPPGSRPFAGQCVIVHAYDAILRSADSGHTWSAPVKIMGSSEDGPFPFAPGSGTPLDAFDRPWVAVDQSTGTVYAAAHNLVDHEGFVTASTDGGRSFGTIYAFDSPTYPSDGLPSGTIAAANGAVAVAYTAASAPGATCPCVIFETSTDQGATFTRHIVPVIHASSVPRPFLAADPTGRGHFALAIFDATGTENQVYVTDDFGQTWRGPTLVAEAPANQRFKPWLSYSPSGQLALVWRTLYSNGAYDVWAAVGRGEEDAGAVFSPPVRVSSVAAPYPPLSGGGAGDDFSWIIADHRYVHVGWGDSRNGRTEVWYGRIRLLAFERQD